MALKAVWVKGVTGSFPWCVCFSCLSPESFKVVGPPHIAPGNLMAWLLGQKYSRRRASLRGHLDQEDGPSLSFSVVEKTQGPVSPQPCGLSSSVQNVPAGLPRSPAVLCRFWSKHPGESGPACPEWRACGLEEQHPTGL